jgi:F0F1-type ATP synthase assembly protein I
VTAPESASPAVNARWLARDVVLAQLGATALVALVSYVLAGGHAALAASVGGGIGVATTVYLAFALLRAGMAGRADRFGIGLLVTWVVKVVLTLGLLVAAFRAKLPPLPLLVGLFGTMVAYWLKVTFGRVKHADRSDG